MIEMLRGEVAHIAANSIILMANGVGYKVFVPKSAFDTIHEEGQAVTLHTHLSANGQNGPILFTLYGFTSLEDKELFEMVITVNGVGPKLGLAILSTLSAGQLRQAIGREEAALLTRVPGVGKKTAEKIIFELKNKVGADGLSPLVVVTDVDRDVIAALTSLGYSLAEAQAALQSIPRSTPQDLNTRIALALQYFG
jgi:Holliday junction DNA helicase RuvA